MSKKLIKKLIEDISALGALPFYLFLSLFFLVINQSKLFIWFISGLFFAYLGTILIRITYHKDRPIKAKYKNLIEKIDASSFPSLHSWRATMIAFFLITIYNNPYLNTFIILFAFSIYFSRYYLKKHYILDIIFGIIFGLMESLIIISFI